VIVIHRWRCVVGNIGEEYIGMNEMCGVVGWGVSIESVYKATCQTSWYFSL